jgi:hypothetical protein
MKLLATGAQYKVFDLQNGRVKKQLLSRKESQAVIASWYAPDPIPVEVQAVAYDQIARKTSQRIRRLLSTHPELSKLLGDPIFETETTYTQIKVQPLMVAFKKRTLMQNRQLIEDFAKIIVRLWQFGIADTIYNCAVNYGVDAVGKIIFLDFGEVRFTKQAVRTDIVTKKWLQSHSYRKAIPETLKSYYAEALDKHLTIEVLNKVWKKIL